MVEYSNRESERKQAPRRTLHLPALLLATGAGVLYLAAELPDFVQRGRRLPGPRYFPALLGVFLCAAGAIELAQYLAWRRRNRDARRSVRTVIASSWRVEPSAASAAVVLALLIAFAGAVGFLGFQVSALLFSLAMLAWFHYPLGRTLVVSVALVVIISLVFGFLFRVPLPRGVFTVRF